MNFHAMHAAPAQPTGVQIALEGAVREVSRRVRMGRLVTRRRAIAALLRSSRRLLSRPQRLETSECYRTGDDDDPMNVISPHKGIACPRDTGYRLRTRVRPWEFAARGLGGTMNST